MRVLILTLFLGFVSIQGIASVLVDFFPYCNHKELMPVDDAAEYQRNIATLRQQKNQLDMLMNPGAIFSSTAVNKSVESFDRTAFSALVNVIQGSSFYQEEHERTKNMVEESQKLITDPSSYLQQKGVYQNIQDFIEQCHSLQDDFSRQGMVKEAEHYLQVLLKVSPNDSELMQAQKNLEEIKSTEVKSPSQASSSKKQLPYRAVRDSQLESEFLQLAKAKNPDMIEPIVIINSNKWVNNNNSQGNLISRNRLAVVAYENNSGQCYLQYYSFQQKYNGSSFGASFIASDEGQYLLECSALPVK